MYSHLNMMNKYGILVVELKTLYVPDSYLWLSVF